MKTIIFYGAVLVILLTLGAVLWVGGDENRAENSFCPVNNWGPRTVDVGEGFHVQPDGWSALWILIDCYPQTAKVRFDGQVLPARHYPYEGLITASVGPHNQPLAPGDYLLELVDTATGKKVRVGHMRFAGEAIEHFPAPDILDAHQREAIRALPSPPELTPPSLIAHAGGAYLGQRYRNSVGALDYNYNLGHRVFELDLSWTRDDHLVGIHDWQSAYRGLFPTANHEQVPSLAEFAALPMAGGDQQVTPAALLQWLEDHPDAYIVADIKGKTMAGLRYLQRELDGLHEQVIPQMSDPNDYLELRELGYEQVIYVIYTDHLPMDDIADLVEILDLYAVTVNPNRKALEALVSALNAQGEFVYVYTFNQVADWQRLNAKGVDGIYTDFLYLDDDGEVVRWE